LILVRNSVQKDAALKKLTPNMDKEKQAMLPKIFESKS